MTEGHALKIIVVTQFRNGMASLCLPTLAMAKNVKIVGVVLADPAGGSKWRKLRRKIVKVCHIGLAGAINGLRLRKWYRSDYGDIEVLCREREIPFFSNVRMNSKALQQELRDLSPDLGISLGNGFIAERIFSIPRFGMINVHSEILPAYQNAQSIIWPIYCKDPYSGFTIHEIERKIDSGRILYLEKVPLVFCRTLRETVITNRVAIEKHMPQALALVCGDYEKVRGLATTQSGGRQYTTPTLWQYWRMVMNNRMFYRKNR